MRPTTTTNATNAHNELELAHDPIKEFELLAEDALSLASFVLTTDEARGSKLLSSALLQFGNAHRLLGSYYAHKAHAQAEIGQAGSGPVDQLEELVISSMRAIDYSVGRLSGYYSQALKMVSRASELIASGVCFE